MPSKQLNLYFLIRGFLNAFASKNCVSSELVHVFSVFFVLFGAAVRFLAALELGPNQALKVSQCRFSDVSPYCRHTVSMLRRGLKTDSPWTQHGQILRLSRLRYTRFPGGSH